MNDALATFLGSIVSGLFALGICLVTQSKTKTLIEYRLEMLTKKVDAHNNLIERTYKLEERTELQEEKIRVANRRIADLENERK